MRHTGKIQINSQISADERTIYDIDMIEDEFISLEKQIPQLSVKDTFTMNKYSSIIDHIDVLRKVLLDIKEQFKKKM